MLTIRIADTVSETFTLCVVIVTKKLLPIIGVKYMVCTERNVYLEQNY